MDTHHSLTSVPESSVVEGSNGTQLEIQSAITHNTRLSDRFCQNRMKQGTIVFFCRKKGHGFIQPLSGDGEKIFVHMQDIEGKWVPHEGDIVDYKETLIPPKMEQKQAVSVKLRELNPLKHESWSPHQTKQE